ncbi:MAG TPA: zinc ribbon domain-containing protein [Oscillospiraceae bacterium]|nr:zinc ribbon domain-containing protein [Oscillospiraceae bacterium]HNW05260.1 zinc ribbon domain-containing protein [Oscillospiraceae bacterium]
MTQQILTEIGAKLSSLGIPAQVGNGTDLAIHTEFLDAGWSTGDKKIGYEAAVFANERDNTVYMYEKTTEIGHGFSFGEDSGASFQSGTTLFRKVKSVQYGPDGKAYEYTLDLGAIPKAVKETAKRYGWKFKTVINKNKAMYPAGYAPASAPTPGQTQAYAQTANSGGGYCSNCGMPLADGAKFCDKCGNPVGGATPQTPAPPPAPPAQSRPSYEPAPPQYGNPQGAFYAAAPKKRGKKGGIFGLIGFILLGIALLVALVAAKATPVGWAVCLGLYAAAFLIQRLLRKKGCLLHLILWIITSFLLLISLTMFAEGDLSFTSAGLKNAHMTTAMDANGAPVDEVASYAPDAPELVAVAELRNAPIHTRVRFVWKYLPQDVLIAEYVMDSGENETDVYVFSDITNDGPWPEGEYRVEFYIDDKTTPDATVTFTVTTDTAAVNQGTSPQSLAALLPYEKSFLLDDGKSTGAFKVFISDGTGSYENYSGQMICEFRVTFDTGSLPADFIMDPAQATANNAMGYPSTDGLVMAVCSDTEAYHLSSISSGEWIFNGGDIRPFVETDAATTNMDPDSILTLAANYPKMQVLRYNQNEVGMTQEGDTWTTHAENAFGLHPPVTEGDIPWDEILTDLGLQ